MRRAVDTESDYSDYSSFYDTLAGYYMYDETGVLYTDPSQAISGRDRYTKEGHELRISTPSENRLRFVGGLFYQRQVRDIEQRYTIANMFDDFEVPGWDDTIWLTAQQRVDRDKAVFGQLAFDFTDQLTGTVGLRAFESHNTLIGFFGYGAGFSGSTGEAACFTFVEFHGAPCINLDRGIEEDGTTHSVNLSYHVTPDVMIYGTWSTGFRSGGVNRRIFQQALYNSDTLRPSGSISTTSSATPRTNAANSIATRSIRSPYAALNTTWRPFSRGRSGCATASHSSFGNVFHQSACGATALAAR